MQLKFFLASLILVLFGACSTPIPAPVAVEKSNQTISYLQDVKPILDKRCVTCHSCYNSPCQAKMSSFEGIDRGASKLLVYNATRLKAVDPTRLFIDAKSTSGWREKGFYSITQSSESNATHNDSLIMHLLYDKKMHPEMIGEYAPEIDRLICPRNKEELGNYLEEKPNHGMPYGFPQIDKKEYKTLALWLQQGAKGPTEKEQLALERPSKNAQKEIVKWEKFFNEKNPKHKMSARYLYEHLYLAHIYFPKAKDEFYELVRSYTPPGMKIQVIPSLRPFDDPKVDKFYYRLQKIHSTIVHKTHMTFKFDDRVLQRFNELFIKPKWHQTPYDVGYDGAISANPFVAFDQIPARSRYQFLLDNSQYIIMTFIRGPVCRGQMALNVIHDHFWVMFRDPNFDMAVLHPEFIRKEFGNLELPIKSRSEYVYKVFSDEYRERYTQYYQEKVALAYNEFPQGMGIDSIWRGRKKEDAPLLTIYRHFDSASIHKGALGREPRTMWVIDYAQFERIYYNLVAGYDVFGNVSHQTNIRRYMDFLRLEGELNFLEYMPKKKRLEMFKSWYIGDGDVQAMKAIPIESFANKTVYKTKKPKSEFIESVVEHHILKSTNIVFDYINYIHQGDTLPTLPKTFKTSADFREGARAMTLPGTGFISYMTDTGANNIFLRIEMSDGTFITKNLIINRWHDNVNSLFAGEEVLNPTKDTLDILDMSIGSYPNVFAIVDFKDLPDFMDMMINMKETEHDMKRIKKYFISRSNKDFWKFFDWFQNYFYKVDPLNAGLYDLNRYAKSTWEDEQ